MSANIQPPACPNCEHTLKPEDKFCAVCGQSTRPHRLSFWQVWNDILVNFFAFDSKVAHTLWPLITRPGQVTEEYNSGKMARFVPPMRMYLTISLVYFFFQSGSDDIAGSTAVNVKSPAQTAAIDSLEKELVASRLPGADTSVYDFNVGLPGFEDIDDMYLYSKNNPDQTVEQALTAMKKKNTVFNRFKYRESQKINSFDRREFTQYIVGKIPLFLFLFLPFLALTLKLVYIRQKIYYFEHLIFTYHVQSLFFLLLLLVMVVEAIFGGSWSDFGLLLFTVYITLALKRVYKQSWPKTILKLFVINVGILLNMMIFGMFAFMLSFIFYK